MTWPEAQLPANLLILRIGAPNLLAFIVCAWGIVGAATGMPLRTAQFKLRVTAWGLVTLLCRAAHKPVPAEGQGCMDFHADVWQTS